MATTDFAMNLKKYADLTVQTGANVQPGDTVYVQVAVDQAPLARLIVASAYKAGAAEVLIQWQDDTLSRLNLTHMADDRLENVPPYIKGMFDYWVDNNAKRITVISADPDNLASVDPGRVAKYTAGFQKAYARLSDAITTNQISWTIIGAASPKWAQKVFPDLSATDALAKLWDEIFTTTRVYADDPEAAWQKHVATLNEKAAWLNDQQFDAIHYSAPGTDLTVGLPKHHIWTAAGSRNPKGEFFIPNMPTEEVFTVPDHHRIDGTVSSTKPLSYSGNVLEGMHFTFKNGEVINYKADRGEEVLKQLFTIRGAKSLGEVSLVPDPSPISQSGIIFFNTLFDENASDHMAFGEAYPFCVEGGVEMSPEERERVGLNDADTHVDFMMGSAQMDIDGITQDGQLVPIFRNGDWA
ncbi:aminopeptidase [Lacticaseibacillus songhuajiangensis]|jgi:aminopeptidase|uniref:aminopeptidase n=1 Tax=Lacticaseibacillus songhuajiangensis TaxID=1296539 RepID=UPI000F774456|nr:aminopeptidase [Lacticaseibacillus songhuajiangensis]